jgi:hypothetical protein
VVRGRDLRSAVAEQLVEPFPRQTAVHLVCSAAGVGQDLRELAERDALLLLVPRHGVLLARELGVELLSRLEHLHPLVVEPGGGVAVELAELLALLEVVQDCELRLGRAKRQLLSAVRDPCGEDRILELVLAGAQLDLDETGLAGLA